MVLNLLQLSRSQVTGTLLSELHAIQVVGERLSLGFGLGFLDLVFRHKTLHLFEELAQSLVLRISGAELVRLGPQSRQTRGD